MAVSNGVYFSIIEVPPLQDVGWEVRVVHFQDWYARAVSGASAPGTPIAVISTFADVTISPEISEVGQGSVTLDLDSAFWNTQLPDGTPAANLDEYEHVWQVWEDGLLRFEFLGENVEENIEGGDETRTVTISGPGTAQVLTWGKVMTPTYPQPPTGTQLGFYRFQGTTIMGAWLQLLLACKNRGTDQFVIPTFTDKVDSAGQPWEDTPTYPAIVGQTYKLGSDILFDTDKYNLKPAARAIISDIINGFKSIRPNLLIVGHTDSRSSYAHNMTLSINRAKAVGDYIKSIVPNAVIKIVGKGETQPIATNRTPAGRQKNRRVVVYYTPTLDELISTLPYYEPTLGIDLLALLKEDCGGDANASSPIHAEWFMRPNFQLDVIQRGFGVRRESEVVFYEGSRTTVSKSRSRVRDEIWNVVAVQNDYGTYSIATSSESIARWGRRETYSRQAASYDDAYRGQVALKSLEQSYLEKSTWTIKVPPYAEGRRVFVDYQIGDWIGVSQYRGGQANVVEPFRILAITLKVDANNQVDLELTLQSKQEFRIKKLQDEIQSIYNHLSNGTKVYISDSEPVNAKVGDLWTPKTTPKI